MNIIKTQKKNCCWHWNIVPKMRNKTQKTHAILVFLHSFTYLCPRFGRSRRDIYAALGKRVLL